MSEWIPAQEDVLRFGQKAAYSMLLGKALGYTGRLRAASFEVIEVPDSPPDNSIYQAGPYVPRYGEASRCGVMSKESDVMARAEEVLSRRSDIGWARSSVVQQGIEYYSESGVNGGGRIENDLRKTLEGTLRHAIRPYAAWYRHVSGLSLSDNLGSILLMPSLSGIGGVCWLFSDRAYVYLDGIGGNSYGYGRHSSIQESRDNVHAMAEKQLRVFRAVPGDPSVWEVEFFVEPRSGLVTILQHRYVRIRNSDLQNGNLVPVETGRIVDVRGLGRDPDMLAERISGDNELTTVVAWEKSNVMADAITVLEAVRLSDSKGVGLVMVHGSDEPRSHVATMALERIEFRYSAAVNFGSVGNLSRARRILTDGVMATAL